MINKKIKVITVALLSFIFIVALAFTYSEISSLDENEKILEDIYSSQMETILFSVNQHSDDYVNSWANKIASTLNRFESHDSISYFYNALVNNNKSIKCVLTADTLNNLKFKEPKSYTLDFKEILKNNKVLIDRLVRYSQSNYRKIEPVELKEKNGDLLLLFIAKDIANNEELCGIIINSEDFIYNIIADKISKINQGNLGSNFIIAVINGKNNTTIYPDTASKKLDVQTRKQLWLLPEYYLAMSFTGETVESLVQKRTYTNLIFIIILIILIFVGSYAAFKTIKKDIELAQIKSEFVANVSHELRTPLALITMFAETLEMGRVPSEVKKKEYYTIISQETNRLSKIVNKILNFSKMEAGKRTFNFDLIDINEVACEVFNTYKFHVRNKGFKFEIKVDDSLPLIKADKDAIGEAIINLIDNAVKYSEDEKEIKITTGTTDENIYLEVADKGIGISEENQKRIFDKFFRVTSNLVHNTKGTGLGLSLVKHIMEAHKGDVTVTSTLWKGSTFRLVFPIEN
ncbi:MAG: sensor histidine kinase [Syntrophothermus sp.]